MDFFGAALGISIESHHLKKGQLSVNMNFLRLRSDLVITQSWQRFKLGL